MTLKHPLVTEKAMDEMDFENKLLFICDADAAKPDIREAVETQFDVVVDSVNTQVTMDGEKKATVLLSAEDDAQEVASRIGVF
ncbi:50S ribosomal protein L23 [Halobacteriales archaeon QS_7_69_60]|nr:MAG: 50S ribosomal protein L23 [Halobacteriales archaeon QS_4_69_225]PSQ11204.1 MAG: 50S ribosomal protein L23 [Halobacteriales archaeon QS_7_69_60]